MASMIASQGPIRQFAASSDSRSLTALARRCRARPGLIESIRGDDAPDSYLFEAEPGTLGLMDFRQVVDAAATAAADRGYGMVRAGAGPMVGSASIQAWKRFVAWWVR